MRKRRDGMDARRTRPHEQWWPTPPLQAAVYMATNQITGQSYIGFTAQPLKYRIQGHMSASMSRGDTKFCRAIQEYGRDNFDFIILRTCATKEEGRIAERQLIRLLSPEYNDPASGGRKAIKCLNDGMLYKSAAAAAKAYGLNRYCVAAVANPNAPQGSLFGYKFQYIEAIA